MPRVIIENVSGCFFLNTVYFTFYRVVCVPIQGEVEYFTTLHCNSIPLNAMHLFQIILNLTVKLCQNYQLSLKINCHFLQTALYNCNFSEIIIIIIILFVHKKMYIKHINKTNEQDNKALRSALTAALSTIIAIVKININ